MDEDINRKNLIMQIEIIIIIIEGYKLFNFLNFCFESNRFGFMAYQPL